MIPSATRKRLESPAGSNACGSASGEKFAAAGAPSGMAKTLVVNTVKLLVVPGLVDAATPVELVKPVVVGAPVELVKPVVVATPVELVKPVVVVTPVETGALVVAGALVDAGGLVVAVVELDAAVVELVGVTEVLGVADCVVPVVTVVGTAGGNSGNCA